jgi:acyl carrier protein
VNSQPNPFAPPSSLVERYPKRLTDQGVGCAHLAVAVEDHFGITLTEREQETVHTVGDLVQVVNARIVSAQSARCPSLRAFRALRSLVHDVTGDSKFKVRPRDRVDAVLDAKRRKQLWKWLPSLLATNPRPLRRSDALRATLVVGSLGCLAVAYFIAANSDGVLLAVTLAMSLGVCASLEVVTRSFRVCPPTGWTTFGDIALRIVGVTVATKRLHLKTDAEVMDELRPIIVDICGVDADEVRLDSRFLDDYDLS